MQGFSTGELGVSKMYVCPSCDSFGRANYLPEMFCPFCKYPLFSNDLIYMPNFDDAIELAKARVASNQARRLGFGDDE